MFLNKDFKNLSKENQVKQLEIWISKLRDDDINKIILQNKLETLKSTDNNTYRKTAQEFEVNIIN